MSAIKRLSFWVKNVCIFGKQRRGRRLGLVFPYARVSPSVGRQARLQQHVDHLFLSAVSGSAARDVQSYQTRPWPYTNMCTPQWRPVTHHYFLLIMNENDVYLFINVMLITEQMTKKKR